MFTLWLILISFLPPVTTSLIFTTLVFALSIAAQRKGLGFEPDFLAWNMRDDRHLNLLNHGLINNC